MQNTVKAVSYNIKHAQNAGFDLSLLGNIIKELSPDIVGVQEIDLHTLRSHGIDQPNLLAAAADMPYRLFVPAIDFQGGKYGTLMLSRHPIISSEIIPLPSGESEARMLGHTELDIGGRRLDFFNTHLSYENRLLRKPQFAELAKHLSRCRDFVLTGDFNTADFAEFSPLGACMINNESRRYPTFEDGAAIDNIVFSDSLEEIASGTVEQSYSDHNALWAALAWKQ